MNENPGDVPEKSTRASGGPAALILTGGGARAAYQVGVLRYIAELLPPNAATPFRIICGTSAGAINATWLASRAADFRDATTTLGRLWSEISVPEIYRADVGHVFRQIARSLTTGRRRTNGDRARALLDNTPLSLLLDREIDYAAIQRNISVGAFDALVVTALSYNTGVSVSFCATDGRLPLWTRSQRIGIRTDIGPAHLLASSAIPFVFAPVRIGDDYFGDGAMRQLAPTAPALHLGASRVLVIAASRPGESRSLQRDETTESYELMPPSTAEIGGHVLDSIFTNALGTDLEKVRLVSLATQQIPPGRLVASPVPLRDIDLLVITPSIPLESLALAHVARLPRLLRALLGMFGGTRAGGAGLLSYLLFDSEYCAQLTDLGYRDAQSVRGKIIRHLDLTAPISSVQQ